MTTYFMAPGMSGAPHVENTAHVDVRRPDAVFALCGESARAGTETRWEHIRDINPGLVHCPTCRDMHLASLFVVAEEELAAITEATGESTAAPVEYLRALELALADCWLHLAAGLPVAPEVPRSTVVSDLAELRATVKALAQDVRFNTAHRYKYRR